MSCVFNVTQLKCKRILKVRAWHSAVIAPWFLMVCLKLSVALGCNCTGVSKTPSAAHVLHLLTVTHSVRAWIHSHADLWSFPPLTEGCNYGDCILIDDQKLQNSSSFIVGPRVSKKRQRELQRLLPSFTPLCHWQADTALRGLVPAASSCSLDSLSLLFDNHGSVRTCLNEWLSAAMWHPPEP